MRTKKFGNAMRWALIAFVALVILVSCVYTPKERRMRSVVQVVDSMNSNYVPLDSMEIPMKEANDFFHHFGSNHDKIFADYLLGCVYRDKGETPYALKYLNRAVMDADTAGSNDEKLLWARIYGQIASLYHEQRSPANEIEAWHDACRFAQMAGDSLRLANYYQNMAGAFHLNQQYDSTIILSEKSHHLYTALGYPALAVLSNNYQIDIYLKRHEYNKVDSLIKEFEGASGFFDENHEMIKGRKVFYYYKGELCQQTGKIDSALIYYRKAIENKNDWSALQGGYKGLMTVYQQRGIADSVAKYANLYTEINDSDNIAHSAETFNKMKAVYDYSANQQRAIAKEKEANRYKAILYSIIALAIAGIALLASILKKKKRERMEELRKVNTHYNNLLNEYQEKLQELQNLKEDAVNYKAKKAEEVEKLREMIDFYSESSKVESESTEQPIPSNEIITLFHQMATKIETPTNMQWLKLKTLMDVSQHNFMQKISKQQYNLTEIEQRIAILARLHFIPSEMVVLTNLSKQRISNIRRSLNMKLFKKEGTKDFDRRIRNF